MKRERLFIAGLAAALALLFAFDGATTHVPALLLRLVAATGCVLALPKSTVLLDRRVVIAPGVALVAILLGTATADNLGLAAQAVISALLVIALYLALVASTRDYTVALLVAFGLAAGVHGLGALGERLLGAPRGRGGFFNPNDLAALLAPVLVLTLVAALRELDSRLRGDVIPAKAGIQEPRTSLNSRLRGNDGSRADVSSAPKMRARAVALVAAVVLLALGLWATGSRSGLLAATVGVAIVLVSRLRRLRRVAIALLLLAGLAVAFAPGMRERWSGARDRYAYSRLDIWKASAELALGSLPFGVGLNGYEDAMRQRGIALAGWVRYPKTAHDAHSEVLTAWVEAGIAGLAAVLLAPVFVIGLCWRRYRAGARQEALEGIAVLAAFAVPAVVSASLHVPPVALLAAVWAARLTRTSSSASAAATLALPANSRLTLACILVVIVGAAVPGALGQALRDGSDALWRRGEPQRALQLARWAAAASPTSLGTQMRYRELALYKGAPVLETVDALITLGEHFKKSPAPLSVAAQLLAKRADKPAAWDVVARFYQEAAQRDPHNAMRWVDWGNALAKGTTPAQATAAFERALGEEPNCARALAQLASHAAAEGHEENAHELAERAQRAARRSKKERGYVRAVLSLDKQSENMLAALGTSR